MRGRKFLDLGSYLTMAVTLVLFIVALFVKGFSHDILLEAGVFLVSAKLVIMGYQNGAASDRLRAELRQLRELLERRTDETP